MSFLTQSVWNDTWLLPLPHQKKLHLHKVLQELKERNEKVLSLVHALTCEWSQRLRGSCNLNKLLQLFQNAKRWWTCFAWRCRVRCDQINGTVQFNAINLVAPLLSIISVVGFVQALTANWSTYFCLRCRSRGSEINELPCSSHGQGVKTSPISTAIMTHGLTECCCKFTEKCSDVWEKSKCNLYGIY